MTLRTGAQYRASLGASPRRVWVDGEACSNVALDSRLDRAVATIARIFDLHLLPEHADALTVEDEFSDKSPVTLLQPTSTTDLWRRRQAINAISEASYGFVGRSQEVMNTALAAFAASAEKFHQVGRPYAANAETLYMNIRREQPYIAHGAIDPPPTHQTDNSLTSSTEPLRVVRETGDGIVVRGTKMIATGAAVADELAVFPLPGRRQETIEQSAIFTIPISSPGLNVIVAAPTPESIDSDLYPLSALFTELDCLCFFDDVLVPIERLLYYGEPHIAQHLYDLTGARQLVAHRDITRAVVKLRFMTGLAVLLARVTRQDHQIHIQEMLGEILGFESVAASGLEQSEVTPTRRGRILVPNPKILLALRYQIPQMHSRIVDVIQTLGGATLTMATSNHGEPLFSVARDATVTEFGQRQLLFERLHAGSATRMGAEMYQTEGSQAARVLIQFLEGC